MKTIGINIDGIIRDSFNKFDSQYRKVFIHNPCLVAMNEEDMTMREFTEEEMDEIDRKIMHACYDLQFKYSYFPAAMTQFITNISNVDLNTIPNFIPCGKKLYLTRPKMHKSIRGSLEICLPQFFYQKKGISKK